MPKIHSVKELRDWVAAAQGGDKEAFSEVVKRCQDMAYGIAYAMLGDTGLAQDAPQEAFIAAYLDLGRPPGTRGVPRLVSARSHQA